MNENRRGRISCVLLALALLPPAAAAQSVAPDEIWKAIGDPALDVERALRVVDFTLELEHAELELIDGVLVPAVPVDARSLEFVFLGEGEFRFTPPDEIEADQLERFTGQRTLDSMVESAVLIIGGDEIGAALLQRPSASLDAETRERVESLYRSWVEGVERSGFGIETSMFRIALGDRTHRNYFATRLNSSELNSFYYMVDPTEPEQVRMGQFVPAELDDIERHQIGRFIDKQKRKGRYLSTSLEELGDWNTWISTNLVDAAGESITGFEGVEPTQYTLDATITPRDGRIEAKAQIDLRVELSGNRIVTLNLHPDLEIRTLRDRSGQELAWKRSEGTVIAVLPEATAAGSELRLQVGYGGVVLDEREKGIFIMRTTGGWYPRAGTVDRATYDVTLRWPRKHELLASGRVVDSGEEGDQRWERRRLEIPGFAFSFEVGAFDVVTDRAGHVDLTIGFSKASGSFDKGAKREVIETLKESILFFEETFGAYPMDYLTVATIPRDFSQGYPGFLTLTQYLFWTPSDSSIWVYAQSREDERVETIAHEVSHQWWGNKVGWDSYRDQWLSEALANYSAVVFAARNDRRTSLYLARHASRWRRSLSSEARDGTTHESMGPVVLGHRLQEAYETVVYDKGSVVFSMLARMLDPDQFNIMLRNLADAVNNRVIDTATFLAALARMSGAELDAFAKQFIYGTGMPEVYYDFRFTEASDGAWTIEGTARQIAPAQFRYHVLHTEDGSWHLRREQKASHETSNFSMIVPFQILLDSTSREKATARGLGGTLSIRGASTRFSIPIKEKPSDFWLDQRGEVLARFYCQSRQPKTMLRYRAMELPPEEAEPLLVEALQAPFLSAQAMQQRGLKEKDLKLGTKIENARIHLELARVQLDTHRDAEARESVEKALRTLGGLDKNRYKGTRTVLQGWLDVQSGDYKSAYSRLSGFLRLDFPRMETDTVGAVHRRKKFKTGQGWTGDAYALLAIAAFETGHDVVARQACKEAETRGASMEPLVALMADR